MFPLEATSSSVLEILAYEAPAFVAANVDKEIPLGPRLIVDNSKIALSAPPPAHLPLVFGKQHLAHRPYRLP